MFHKSKAVFYSRLLFVFILIGVFLTLMMLLHNKHYLMFSFMVLLCSILPAIGIRKAAFNTNTDVVASDCLRLLTVPFAALPSIQAPPALSLLSVAFHWDLNWDL